MGTLEYAWMAELYGIYTTECHRHEVVYLALYPGHPEKVGQISVWKKLPDAPLKWSAPGVPRNQLITVGGGDNCRPPPCCITYTHWIKVGGIMYFA